MSNVMHFDELPLALTLLLERESWLRVAASALYVDRRALRSAGDVRNRALISYGAHLEFLESVAVWLRSPVGEIAGWHNL